MFIDMIVHYRWTKTALLREILFYFDVPHYFVIKIVSGEDVL